MRTGEVARAASVNVQTLRYYERRGLLREPARRESGYRVYSPEAVRVVRFIKRAQHLGFSLEEVETLLELARGGPEACEAVQRVARARVAELNQRIGEISAMRDSLQRVLAGWRTLIALDWNFLESLPAEAWLNGPHLPDREQLCRHLARASDSGLRTGQVAEHAGVSIKTVRYYEHRGLLPAPPRRESGYRAYGADAVEMVRFAKRAQRAGLTLDDVRSLFELAEGGPEDCVAAERVARGRVADLDRRAQDLRAMRDSLSRLIETCGRPRRQRSCPLLRSIEPDSTASCVPFQSGR